jgi:hypothetical protein
VNSIGQSYKRLVNVIQKLEDPTNEDGIRFKLSGEIPEDKKNRIKNAINKHLPIG